MIEDFTHMFERMVFYYPEDRFEIFDLLEHPWLKG